MEKENFERERDDLINGKRNIPTKGFIEQFVNNLPHEDKVPEEYQGRDAEDYYSWGYALFGYWENAEDLVHDMNLFYWLDLYQALETDDLNAFEEAVYEILEIEEKLIKAREGDIEEEEEDDDTPIAEGTLVTDPKGKEGRVVKHENNLYYVNFGVGSGGIYGRDQLTIVKF